MLSRPLPVSSLTLPVSGQGYFLFFVHGNVHGPKPENKKPHEIMGLVEFLGAQERHHMGLFSGVQSRPIFPKIT